MIGHFVEELIHRFEVEQQKNDRSGIYALRYLRLYPADAGLQLQ